MEMDPVIEPSWLTNAPFFFSQTRLAYSRVWHHVSGTAPHAGPSTVRAGEPAPPPPPGRRGGRAGGGGGEGGGGGGGGHRGVLAEGGLVGGGGLVQVGGGGDCLFVLGGGGGGNPADILYACGRHQARNSDLREPTDMSIVGL